MSNDLNVIIPFQDLQNHDKKEGKENTDIHKIRIYACHSSTQGKSNSIRVNVTVGSRRMSYSNRRLCLFVQRKEKNIK